MNNEESIVDFELTILLHTDSDYHEEMEAIEQKVKELGGSIEKVEYDGIKTLAYKIDDQDRARYCYLDIKLPKDKPAKMSSWLNLNDNVLRYLLLRTDPRRNHE